MLPVPALDLDLDLDWTSSSPMVRPSVTLARCKKERALWRGLCFAWWDFAICSLVILWFQPWEDPYGEDFTSTTVLCHPSHSVFNVGMGTTLKYEKPERWLGNFSPILLNCVLLLWKFVEAVEAVEDTAIVLNDIKDGTRWMKIPRDKTPISVKTVSLIWMVCPCSLLWKRF